MEEKKRYTTTQAVLSIRVLVGAYVIYMAYGILTSGNDKSIFMILAAILLGIAGAILVALSGLQLMRGQYAGGKADKGEIEAGEADLIEGQKAEHIEADIAHVPTAQEMAVDFNNTTTIETVEESEITELD